ncbi:MAG: hypothetical protein HFI07_14600 [Lachnospiraceae bacterium]|nr:hypothetical protein [Lachnospiraceae bacterium]
MGDSGDMSGRHAFVASVPFTLMEAIHFTLTYDLDADVYITKSYTDAANVAERLKTTKVFKNVYLVENVLLEYPITVKKCIKIVVQGKKLVKELKTRRYDYGYYNNSGWLINSIFYTGFIKGNGKCKQRFIEHGFNSMINDYADKPWYMRGLINLFAFKCMDGSMLEALYLFEPKLLRARHDGEKRVMPKMDRNDDRFRETVNTVFGYSDKRNEFIDKQVIIMEEGPQKEYYDKSGFWSSILNILDTSNAIIKPHPRLKESTLTSKCDIPVCKNSSIPWEVFAMNMNMEEKIQIAMFSSSCFFPKALFGIEARVILLYKLLPIGYEFLGKDFLDYTKDIENLYEDKERFFVPSNIKELKIYLKKLGLLCTKDDADEDTLSKK